MQIKRSDQIMCDASDFQEARFKWPIVGEFNADMIELLQPAGTLSNHTLVVTKGCIG